ncbi:MAG: PAC2 family protein, partial [Candidatus Diapherotrites archaeon]|nr:PAC2 family protein [Candidatus Diapherotrites archaeon]
MATKVVFLGKKKLAKPVLLVGLPGIGLVGKICVDYFLRQFKTEKIAEIYSDCFPPS